MRNADTQTHTSGFGWGTVARTASLPGIIPRVRELFGDGFSYFAFFIALVYRAVGLLPATHAYVSPANIGRFGIRHVIGEAANNIVLKRKNIDQIIVFFAIIAAMILIVLQFFYVLIALSIPTATAAVSFSDMFTTEYPRDDLAFIFLDRVFGVPGLFESCVSTDQACRATSPEMNFGDALGPQTTEFPWAFHHAMHALFEYYSYALLVVAVILFMYFIVAIVAETAQTGTPFGKRFNSVWAPIRMVVALGLLIPLGHGLNGSQYITLYAAKMGSSLATNGWIIFNEEANNAMLGQGENMIAKPNPPEDEIKKLVTFFYFAHMCKHTEEIYFSENFGSGDLEEQFNSNIDERVDDVEEQTENRIEEIQDEIESKEEALDDAEDESETTRLEQDIEGLEQEINIVGENASDRIGQLEEVRENFEDADEEEKREIAGNLGAIEAWIVRPSYRPLNNMPLKSAEFEAARSGGGQSITVNFGQYKPGSSQQYLGNVKPVCGQVTMQLDTSSQPDEAQFIIEENYYTLLKDLWANEALSEHARKKVDKDEEDPEKLAATLITETTEEIIGDDGGDDGSASGLTAVIETAIQQKMENEYGASTEDGEITGGSVPEELRERGWGAAGVWYNRIADMNGQIQVGVSNVPNQTLDPLTMRVVCEQRDKTDEGESNNCYNPVKDDGKINLHREGEEDAAKTYSQTFNDIRNQMDDNKNSDYLSSVIQSIFGTEGLMSIRDNRGVHPLAQLSGVGRSLIEATVRNLGLGLGATGVAGVSKVALGGFGSGLAGNAGSFFFTVASIGLTAGFVLFYIVPFLPFIYFFFAVSKWVKGIFEAMVGAPLWALAHIRIDGQGLPGDAARSGYELMLEIFLRPILIVFGLLAGLSVFSAQVIILNDIFDLVTTNLTGVSSQSVTENMKEGGGAKAIVENVRGPIDQLFFTVMYAIIIYLMATPSFKLVDQLPNSILRWMGSSVTSFADQQEDPAGSLVQYGAVGGAQIFSSGTGAMSSMSKGLGK